MDVGNVFADVENADVALISGSNTTANHPVAATFMKQAAREGKTKIIVVEPRRIDMADHAEMFLQIRSGTDVAFYNAMMNVIIEEGRSVRSGAMLDLVADEETIQRYLGV